jgi:hypothetical protein
MQTRSPRARGPRFAAPVTGILVPDGNRHRYGHPTSALTPGAVLARPLHDLKDPNEFEPREQDQAAQTAGLARTAPIGLWATFPGGRASGRGGARVCAGLQGYRQSGRDRSR